MTTALDGDDTCDHEGDDKCGDKGDDKSDDEGEDLDDDEEDDKSDDDTTDALPDEIAIPQFDGNDADAFSKIAPFADKVRAQTRALLAKSECLTRKEEKSEASLLEMQEEYKSLLEKVKSSRHATCHNEI